MDREVTVVKRPPYVMPVTLLPCTAKVSGENKLPVLYVTHGANRMKGLTGTSDFLE